MPPDEQDDWTVADAAELFSGVAYELVDGQVVLRAPNRAHAAICEEVVSAVRANCPRRCLVSADQLLWVDACNEFRPSVVVTPREHGDRDRVPIERVTLVIDVLSEFVSYAETELKATAFARAGIPSYWVIDQQRDKVWLGDVDLDPARIPGMPLECRMDTSEVFGATQPWPITLDLRKLTARRAMILAESGSKRTAPQGR